MPEYLSPGVYVEEVPSGAHPIEGVATSTAGFIGRSVEGPINRAVGPILSIAEYTKQFGNGSDFQGEAPHPNYLWHAVRAFFTEGGKRLYVARVGPRTPHRALKTTSVASRHSGRSRKSL